MTLYGYQTLFNSAAKTLGVSVTQSRWEELHMSAKITPAGCEDLVEEMWDKVNALE